MAGLQIGLQSCLRMCLCLRQCWTNAMPIEHGSVRFMEMQTSRRCLIVGAGGHGKVVADAILSVGEYQPVFVDDRTSLWGGHRMGLPIDGCLADCLSDDDVVHIAIGDNASRRKISMSLEPVRCVSVLHPAAVISRFVEMSHAVFVAAMAVIGPDTRIGAGVIVNHGAVVDHDCLIDDYVHVAPRANLAGGVSVGAGTLIGSGAVVLPGVRIGEQAVIGAGAVVRRDVPDGATVVGVPAHEIDIRIGRESLES
ncbi:acetyltransferase [Alcaligenaceae bacterium SJ-26]|nr:acetyltransferase [Alcaligenaceae bacterium SJ-26]